MANSEPTMTMTIGKIQAIARVLKSRFPNLSVEETLSIAGNIWEALVAP